MSKQNLSRVSKFLVWCGGADIELLATCARPVVMKHAQLGFLILIPSFFAFISASYMLSTVFVQGQQAFYIALAGGLFWGIVIFSLDRFLVMTVKKSKNVLRDLFSVSVLTRMALAMLVGYVVAFPLVLKMFDPNLKEILHTRNEQKAKTIAKEYEEKIAAVETEINTLAANTAKLQGGSANVEACREDPELRRLFSDKQNEIIDAEREYIDEVAGNSKSRTGRPNVGPIARSIREKIDNTLKPQLRNLQTRLETALADCKANQQTLQQSAVQENALRTTQLQQIGAQFTQKQRQLADLHAERQTKIAEFNAHAANDFLTLTNTLDELAQHNPNVRFWNHLLTAVLCVVDLLAMLIKMTCQPDEYDGKKQAEEFYRHDDIEQQVKAYQESAVLRMENALQCQQYQAARTKLLQQAEHNLQRLHEINLMLAKLAEISNEFTETIGLLELMGKIPAHSVEFKKIVEDYQQVIAAISLQLTAAQ